MPKAFRPRGRDIVPWLALIAVVIVVDQLTKIGVAGMFAYGARKEIIHGFFDLTLVFNKGAAFSFLSSAGGWQQARENHLCWFAAPTFSPGTIWYSCKSRLWDKGHEKNGN